MHNTEVGVTYKVTKYLNFTVVKKTDKTIVVGVGNNMGEKLGYIKWIGSFRKYGFTPLADLQFDTTCLKEIVEQIEALMEERKQDAVV